MCFSTSKVIFMLRAKSIESVLLGVSITLASTAATAQVSPMLTMEEQKQKFAPLESTDSLEKAVDREKKLRELEQISKLPTSGAPVAGNEPSPIRKTVPDPLLEIGPPQVLSLTGVGQQLVAEILHYGRVYRVDNSASQLSNGLWRAVRVTSKGVLLRPTSSWKVNQLVRDRSGNVFLPAPQPGESFPSAAPYAPAASASGSLFSAARVEAPVTMISADGQSSAVTPAQSLATMLPPMR
jgi:hypothetical protein